MTVLNNKLKDKNNNYLKAKTVFHFILNVFLGQSDTK